MGHERATVQIYDTHLSCGVESDKSPSNESNKRILIIIKCNDYGSSFYQKLTKLLNK